ncbi:MAG: DNA-binding domain-containing protein [Ketobacter sp.]
MTLRALQHDYYQAMQGNDSALKARVQGAGDLSTEQALAVYRNNTEQTLLSVLQQSFSVCRMLVGERCFNQLALRYCRTHPSSSLDLNAYGELFPNFIDQRLAPGEPLQVVPYLGDMARLEWLLQRAYHAANRTGFDFSRFARLTPEQQPDVRFTLAPDVAVVAVQWPVADIWTMHQSDADTLSPLLVEQALQHVLVERAAYRPQPSIIDRQMYDLVRAIDSGRSFAGIVSLEPDSAQKLTDAIQRNWVTGFYD